MDLEAFKLREQPFGVTPDPRFFFLGAAHTAAVMSLVDGIDAGRGFLALIAMPGLGKTTLLQHVMKQLRVRARTVFMFQTVATPIDLLSGLLRGLGVQNAPDNLFQMQVRLKEILVEQYRAGKRVVLVIDEAQNLDNGVLEVVRMLSNFETSREKLMQIILCGQPQLAEKIASPGLEQLRQRVSSFAQLHPFSQEDTKSYINHRLRVAGYSFTVPLFTRDAMTLIAEASEGIPRKINNLCFNALSLASASQRRQIDSEIVRAVVADLNLERFKTSLVLRVDKNGRRGAAPISSTAGWGAGFFGGWTARFAVMFALLFVLAGGLFAGRLWPSRQVVTEAKSAPPAVNAEVSVPPASPLPPATTLAPGAQTSTPAPAPYPDSEPTVAASPVPVVMVDPKAPTTTPAADPAPAWAPTVPYPIVVKASEVAVSTVSVTPGKTLLGICADNFGTCSPELLQQIRELNPRINDLDHIETGQKLRLPAAKAGAE